MAYAFKEDDNTPVLDINTITNPSTKSMIDRYVFASNFCKEKTVLDCPTGHHYGAKILEALGAKSVVGFDLDEKAKSKAIEMYGDKTLFYIQDMTQDWQASPSFDCVVSIEGFEHVPRETVPQMLQNFKNICKKGGKIIITTPNRRSPEFVYQGGTHLYEYTVEEFAQELANVFPIENIELWMAFEFFHPASPELNTVFTKDFEYKDKANVQIAVITNE